MNIDCNWMVKMKSQLKIFENSKLDEKNLANGDIRKR